MSKKEGNVGNNTNSNQFQTKIFFYWPRHWRIFRGDFYE